MPHRSSIDWAIDLFKDLKKIVSICNLVDSPTSELGGRFSFTNISANSKPKSEQLEVVNQRYTQRYKQRYTH